MDLQPELIMTSSIGGEWDVHSKLTESGFKVVLNGEYMETDPLGRSEWIKFLALFFDRETQAREVFESIAQQYESLRARAVAMKDKPTVFTDTPYQGNWWIAGGGSYMARFIEDAGARYVWSDDPSAGSRLLAFEAIFEAAHTADYWINPGSWRSLRDGLAADERFTEFAAFQKGQVFNNNVRANSRGGNDYWESGVARPHEILADLIKIFHPGLLPDHKLKYYRRLDP
jgi:iron complex transport system substrate-binding protein